MKPNSLISLLTFVCLFHTAYAQHKFKTGKEPSWISKQTIDYQSINLNKDAENGIIDLDFEKQVSLADRSTYIRRSFKILSEAGVQDNSQVTITFDPSYEQLTIHTIEIIRDGQVLNKLEPAKMKTIQQETDLNKYIYDGTLQAVLFLEDVRKNDIIEYSFTVKGFNPIFQNKYSDFYTTQYAEPYYNIYYKLIVPQGRTVHVENSKQTLAPTTHTEPGETTYEWKLANVAPLHLQDNYPNWLDPYPCVMVSEFSNWNEVGKWASALFPKVNTISGEMQKKVQQIKTQYSLPEERTAAALRFVQDDIRYMGLEMGVHSHLPASPDKTFSRRFGDCKEKSYLLATMLQKMDIEAVPVLINADYTKAINNWQPSPYCFNHTTVRVKLADGYHWFDPTISYQRGNLAAISYPDYEAGLIVSDTSTALTKIKNQEQGDENIKEIFTVSDMTGKAKLKVLTTFSGSFADNIRNDFSSNSVYEMLKGYQQFYQFYFPKITADSLSSNDDEKTGLFTTTEYYSIDSFWTMDKEGMEQSVEPYIINSIIKKPKQRSRNIPFAIPYPLKYHEEIEINLADDWNLKPFHQDIKTDAFTFTANSIVTDKKISIEYDYENLKDNVTPEEAPEYFAKLKEKTDNDSYTLTFHDSGKSEDSSSYTAKKSGGSNPLFSAIPIILLIAGVVWWSQRKQHN